MASWKDQKEFASSSNSEDRDGVNQYRFGAFVLDLQRHGLYLDGNRVHLTPKPFETLVVLVRNQGITVEKQKLLDAVWKNTAVTEDTLVKAIREIRRVIGDDKGNPKFIQTVSGEGYRFVGDVAIRTPEDSSVEFGSLTASPSPLPARASGESNSLSSQRFVIVAIFVVAACVTGGVIWRWHRQPSTTERQQMIVAIPGQNNAASFSPDGSMAAFVRPVSGMPQVWVKNIRDGEPIQITFGTEGAHRPRWSPRNDQIVFSVGSLGADAVPIGQRTESIWSVPPLGGTARKIIDSASNPNWSADGRELVFERGAEIWTALADGSQQRRVEGIPPVDMILADRTPSFSPDGSTIAFFQPEAGPLGDFWVIPTVGGEPRRLTFDVAAGRSPVWTPDGKYIVFSSQRGGSTTLWKVPALGGTPEPVLIGAGEDTDPDITLDGKHLLYTHRRVGFTLTVLDPSTGKSREIVQHNDVLSAPSFSGDGERISFFSHESDGEIHLFTVPTAGGKKTRVTWGKGERNTFPQWSADNAALYFYQSNPTVSFRKILLGAAESSTIVDGWKLESQGGAQVDMAGKLIAYTQMQKSVATATVLRDMVSGNEIKLNRALVRARWSHTGNLLAGAERVPGSREGDIYVCSINPEKCDRLTRGYYPRWSIDDSVIYFLRSGPLSNGAELWSIGRMNGTAKHIADLQPMHFAHFYDVSPKGEVVYVSFQSGDQELWVAGF
jgi:Tol biopolymer transport system component/DNA-binding winged helix-turn-helix (wHTH) protein